LASRLDEGGYSDGKSEVKLHSSVPVVFAGISLPHSEVARLLSADIRPPVRRGDLDALRDRRVVAIIDGELDKAAVLPVDEIRRAIARGFDVWGAASVGALRAAELRQSGMQGAGWVYEAFCAGRIAGADEIAVIYDAYSLRPLTIPLVSIRFCLEVLVTTGKFESDEVETAMTALKRLTVEQRDRRTVLLQLADTFGQRRLKTHLKMRAGQSTSIKGRDARDLLRKLVDDQQDRAAVA